MRSWNLRASGVQCNAVRLACLALLALATWPAPANAWSYDEHRWLGRTAYAQVCLELRGHDFEHLLKKEERQRLEIACPGDASTSVQYGQFAALSGDHLDAENTQGIRSNIAAKDLVGYLLRASHNADHFHPVAPIEWRSHHKQSLNAAVAAAHKATYLEQVDAFWVAFYLNAYADHFLQDSFAAGHSGFNRPSSTPSAAHALHGRDNSRGKLMRDGAGREWRSFGDDHLWKKNGSEEEDDEEGRARVWFATEASILDFLMAFVVGQRNRSLERNAALRIPTEADERCSTAVARAHSAASATRNRAVDVQFARDWATEAEAAGQPFLPPPAETIVPPAHAADCVREGRTEESEWRSLLLVQEPAKYVVTHDFGFTDMARVNDFEHVWAPTYSFAIYKRFLRYGMDLGWFLSTREQGNAGVLLTPTVTFPLGGKYGSLLAWDIDAKFAMLFPALNRGGGTAFVQHFVPSLGAGMSVQAGPVVLRVSGGPTLWFSNQLKLGSDHWNTPGVGWYAQAGLVFVRSPSGGGSMNAPIF